MADVFAATGATEEIPPSSACGHLCFWSSRPAPAWAGSFARTHTTRRGRGDTGRSDLCFIRLGVEGRPDEPGWEVVVPEMAGRQTRRRLLRTRRPCQHWKPSDTELASIGPRSGLLELELTIALLDEKGFSHLDGLGGLEVLTLRGCRVDDTALAHVKQLSRLRKLYMTGTVAESPTQG